MKQYLDTMVKNILSRIHIYYFISFVYMVVSFVLGAILNNFLVIFLAWNMFLATLVFLISNVLVYLYKKKASLWILLLGLGLWILVFPNSIYMLTDFIHIQNYTFFIRYADIYNYSLSEWFVFAHILIGALYAAKLGISAIHVLETEVKKHTQGFHYIILSLLFVLSSFGIFLGRFLRFNSWNFIEVISDIGRAFSHGYFLIGFVGLFFVLHWAMYFLFSNKECNINIESNHKSEEK